MGAQGADKLTQFTPTPNMRLAVRYLKGCDYDSKVSVMCESIGIARRSYYDWWEKPGFGEWWDAQSVAHFTRRLPAVRAAALAAALEVTGRGDKKHDVAAIKLVMERFDEGYAPRSRQDQTTRTEHGADVNLLDHMDGWITSLKAQKAGGSANG